MFQLIYDVLESKRKNIPDTPNSIFYRRLLLWIIGVPVALTSVVMFVAFIRMGIFDMMFNSNMIFNSNNRRLLEKDIFASGIGPNAWFIMVLVFDAFFVIGAVFWCIKPRTEKGIKKALSRLNYSFGIVGVIIAIASLTYGGYQAGIVELGFAAFSLIVGLLIGLRG